MHVQSFSQKRRAHNRHGPLTKVYQFVQNRIDNANEQWTMLLVCHVEAIDPQKRTHP